MGLIGMGNNAMVDATASVALEEYYSNIQLVDKNSRWNTPTLNYKVMVWFCLTFRYYKPHIECKFQIKINIEVM